MKKVKASCVYLDENHEKYLKVMSFVSGKSKSQLLREMLNAHIEQNKDIIEKYETLTS